MKIRVASTVVLLLGLALSACGGGGSGATESPGPATSSSSSSGGVASSSSASSTSSSSSSASSAGYAEVPRPSNGISAKSVFWMRTDATRFEYVTNNLLHVYTSDSDQLSVTTNGRSISASVSTFSRYMQFDIFPGGSHRATTTWIPTATETSRATNLEPGLIQQTRRYAVIGLQTGMDVSIGSRACPNTPGAIYVHEIAFDASNTKITKLAADFAINCGPLVNGAIRHNSTVPIVSTNIYVITGNDVTQLEGRALTLDGSISWSPAEKIVAYQWRQISGPSLDLSRCDRVAICQTYTPLVSPGGGRAVVELTVTTESGRSASRQMKIDIRSHRDKQSRLEVYGYGWIASSKSSFYNETNVYFNPKIKHTDVPTTSVTGGISPDAQQPEQFVLFPMGTGPFIQLGSIQFSSPKGVPVSPGTYHPTSVDLMPQEGIYQFGFSWDSRGCGSGYSINNVVLSKINRSPTDLTVINELNMVFDSLCCELLIPESDPSYGLVWINYQPVGSPTAVITGDQTVAAGTEATLSGALSHDANGRIIRYAWSVLIAPWLYEGLNVYTPSTTSSMVSIPIPSNAPSGMMIPVALEVIDNEGNTAVTIHQLKVK